MEGKNILLILGVMLLVSAGFGWPLLAAAYYEKQARENRGEPPRFDERQRLARQRGGNHALYVLIGFLIVWACLDMGGWFGWTGSVLDLVLCALPLTLGVWTADCVLHSAFSGWKEKNTSDSFALSLMVIIANFISPFWIGGFLKSRLPGFFAMGSVLALGGVYLYQHVLLPRMAKQAEDEGEDEP